MESRAKQSLRGWGSWGKTLKGNRTVKWDKADLGTPSYKPTAPRRILGNYPNHNVYKNILQSKLATIKQCEGQLLFPLL